MQKLHFSLQKKPQKSPFRKTYKTLQKRISALKSFAFFQNYLDTLLILCPL